MGNRNENSNLDLMNQLKGDKVSKRSVGGNGGKYGPIHPDSSIYARIILYYLEIEMQDLNNQKRDKAKKSYDDDGIEYSNTNTE